MRRAFIGILGAALAAIGFMTPAAGQSPLRLYVLDGGTLGGKAAIPVYLIVHPKGTLLFEGGTIPDAMIESGAVKDQSKLPPLVKQFNATATRTLRSQLAALGYKPAGITFFAASHYHFDHIANANDYRTSTWLVQRVERDAMFAAGPTPFGAEPSFYSGLKEAKTTLLNGDHDVFGDGTVILKPTPGHTAGHQALYVKLPKTGGVVLSGDVYHGDAEREKPLETIPEMDVNKAASAKTRPALEAFVKQAGAQLWIAHDMVRYKSQKHPPQYYD